MIISPSILSADFKKLESSINEVKNAPFLHIDIMDGEFVPNISFGPMVQSQIRPSFKEQVFDTHLMIEHPQNYIDAFAKAGSDYITFHIEADCDVKEVIDKIHSLNIKAGLSIKPGTSVDVIKPYLPYLDMVLVMSVHPGFGGQKFIPESIDKVKEVKKLLTDKGLENVDIEIDGGINIGNLASVLEAGVNVVVAGSAVFKDDAAENVRKFKEIMSLY